MVYVMLSRVCSHQQIIIIDTFDETKMYPNKKALQELERLEKISINQNPIDWDIEEEDKLKITSLNCREYPPR